MTGLRSRIRVAWCAYYVMYQITTESKQCGSFTNVIGSQCDKLSILWRSNRKLAVLVQDCMQRSLQRCEERKRSKDQSGTLYRPLYNGLYILYILYHSTQHTIWSNSGY